MKEYEELPAAIIGFLDAINNRDVAAAEAFLTEDVSYQLLVPHPKIVGRTAVLDALSASITEADRVSWEVVTFAVGPDLALVERIDRFWFDGNEASIDCTGVFELRGGRIAAVRDYADLDTWRRRKQAALES